MNKATKTTILQSVSFAVPQGSLFAITGPSESGKATQFNILTGIDRPTTGQVLFDGKALRAMSKNKLAKWRTKPGILRARLIKQQNILACITKPEYFCVRNMTRDLACNKHEE